jgi:hypothetical protein
VRAALPGAPPPAGTTPDRTPRLPGGGSPASARLNAPPPRP